ncbi:unnamed protein product [Cochlearia groenlandica]
MSKKPCCVGEGLKKGSWTVDEDKKLISYVNEHGEGRWRDIPQKAGLKRCGKSCRLRWANYLKPTIKRGDFSYEEEQIIIMLHASRGNKTDNEVKNYWHTHLKKRLIDQGIDPVTHNPLASNTNSDTTNACNVQEDDHDNSNPSENSQSGSMMMSPKSLPPSSSLCNLLETISNNSEKTPRYDDCSLNSKKRYYKGSNSTSKLLNKIATKASSMGDILSASIGGTISSTPMSSSINDEYFSETSSFLMEEFDLFSHSYEHIVDHTKEDIGVNIGLNNSEYDFSEFFEQFSSKEGEKAENIGEYSGHDLLMTHDNIASSMIFDEDNMLHDINGWSNDIVDQFDYTYDTNQEYDVMNFI